METRLVKVEDIVRLPEVQIRTKINKVTVNQYVEQMNDGVKFDPLDGFIGADAEGQVITILGDGFHRLLAYEERGIPKVEVNIHECAPEEAVSQAIEFSCERNGKHGLPLSRADKRNAVIVVLQNPILKRRGDRPIAKMVGVSPQLVKDVRYELANVDNTTDVSAHKRKPKSKIPDAQVEEPGDDNEERIKTFERWVDEGKIEWPNVVKAFESASHTPMLIPRTPHKVVLVRGDKKMSMEVTSVSIKRKDGVQLLVIEGPAAKEAKA